MKFSYLGLGLLSTVMVLLVNPNEFSAHPSLPEPTTTEWISVNSDSLKIDKLATDLKKLKPLSVKDFTAKFSKKEINGFKLIDVKAYEDADTGSSAYVNFAKGSQNIYLMITDGAGAGSEQVKSNLLNYLDLKEIEEPGSNSTVKLYKGWLASFDWSMYKEDGLTSIQYLEGNRFAVVSSANKVSIEELESFLNNLTL